MADFVQMMKDWRRMCKFYSDNMIDSQNGCLDMCPLGHNTACGYISKATDENLADMERDIIKWAAEHPEPQYPTWREYLENSQGMWLAASGAMRDDWISNTHIPADIAEKLGIEPREG